MALGKPYELQWPLNPEQFANIDDMFRILFDSAGGSASDVFADLIPFTVGDLLVADSEDTFALLPDVAAGNVLLSGGVGVSPAYGKVLLDFHVDGVLPPTSGGTGFDTYAIGDILYADTTSSLARLPIGAAGTVLNSDGTIPFWDLYLHALLSESHTDTIPASPVLGDIIVAQQAPGESDGWLDGLWGPGIATLENIGGVDFWLDGEPMLFLNAAVKWQRFGLGAAGTVLTSTGSGVAWL